jgi:hypothetical protein
MANTIKIKRSTVAGKVPVPGDLEVGEIAVNTADGIIYTKHTNDSIVTVSNIAAVLGPNGFTVSEIDPNTHALANVVTHVNTIRFDSEAGFDVIDLGSGAVKVGMNSTFKYWEIDGQDTLTAVGLDTIHLIAGNNVSLTTNIASHPKSLTISSRAIQVTINDIPPDGAHIGDVWYDSESGASFQYISDGTSEFWIQFGTSF